MLRRLICEVEIPGIVVLAHIPKCGIGEDFRQLFEEEGFCP
jgi:hypothetical protein